MKKYAKYFVLMIIGIIILTGCSKKVDKDYSGTYKSDDSSEMIITKNHDTYKASISLYRLTTIENCNIDNYENDILNISCQDENSSLIKFKFDYNTKVLTVTESTWSLLSNGDSFELNK